MTQDEIRDQFIKEFEGTQDSRSDFHTKFSEQGVRLIEHRKKVIETTILVSAGLIAVSGILDLIKNTTLYHWGLALTIITIIFSLLFLKEHVDMDEAQSIATRNTLLPILDNRIVELKKYLSKPSLTLKDLTDYQKYRENEDSPAHVKEMNDQNQRNLETVQFRKNDSPTSLIMFLFISSMSFVLLSILFCYISIVIIIIIELFILIITSNNVALRIADGYSRLIR